MIKKILLFILVFVSIISLVYAIEGNNDNTKNNYDWTFIDATWSSKSIEGSSFWGSHSYNDIGFSDEFWMKIEPWEYGVCTNGLTSQLNEKENPIAIGGSIYDITITASANQFYSIIDDSKLYEVSWYVHPNGAHGHKYTVSVKTDKNEMDIIQESTAAGPRRGSQGYQAFYSTKNYTLVYIIYDNQEYKYEIIPGLDANKRKK